MPRMEKNTVIAHFGSEAEVAKVLEISRQAVNQWPNPIPEGAAYKLQVLTGGVLRVNPRLYAKESAA